MKKGLFLGMFWGAALATLTLSCSKEEIKDTSELSSPYEPGMKNGHIIQGRYIVVLNTDERTSLQMQQSGDLGELKSRTSESARSVLGRNDIPVTRITQLYGIALSGFAIEMSEAEARKLAADSQVKLVEPDRVVRLNLPVIQKKPGGTPGGGGGGGGSTQTTPYGITRVGGAGNGAGKTAWIIDTGIDLDHPDLNVDVSRSVSFVTTGGPSASSPDDLNGHGTHVAGTIAAINNSEGVVGVAAGASVVAVRVLDRNGSGSYSWVIAGVDYVAANASQGDVANMSLGGPVSTALDDAVIAAAQAGVKFALAAGNESDDANNHSPARANHANIYTVSAMNSSDDWAYFSNYANPPVDYCAPGFYVESCYKDGGYATLSGTSMAAPHVAGILLLGNITSDGAVNGDPDGTADPIAHR